MKLNVLCSILLLIVVFQLKSQENFFTSNDKHCEANYSVVQRGTGNNSLLASLPSPLDGEDFMLCGSNKFRIIFMDIVLDNGIGFDDPTLGATRRSCVCEVINYLEEVLSIPSNIGNSDPTIDIIFNVSDNIPPPLYGQASPVGPVAFFNAPTTVSPGYYGGYVYDYITGSPATKPDILSEDGQVAIRFDGVDYYYCTGDEIEDCQVDFFSLILHEITHTLGFLSFAVLDGSNLESQFTNNVFSIWDKEFLYYSNDNINYEKLFDISVYSATGGVNPNAINSGTSSKIWLHGQGIDTKQNIPVTSGSWGTGRSLCHVDRDYRSRTCLSPGYSPNFVMNPFIEKSDVRRTYSIEELETLQQMGYTINPNISEASILGNHTPFHPGNIITSTTIGVNAYPNQTIPAGLSELQFNTTTDNPIIVDLQNGTISNGIETNLVQFIDLDNDPITVFEPASGEKGVYNIRGAGINGNNSDGLSLNLSRNIITYTPRANFIGRAQFGFHLYDGKQKGDYVVITVDVAAGTNFINTPVNEFVINGGFEEGTEVWDINQNFYRSELNRYTFPDYVIKGKSFTDAVQFSGFYFQQPFIRNSNKECVYEGNCFDQCSFNTNLNPVNNLGDRYISFEANQSPFNFSLAPSNLSCTYILEFDLLVKNFVFSGAYLEISLHDLGINQNANQSNALHTEIYNLTGITVDQWNHISIPISYLQSQESRFIQFKLVNQNIPILLDNVSLKESNIIPDIAFNTPESISFCANQSTSLIPLTGAPSGTTFSWSNSNTAIGLAASGTGTGIPSFTALNTTNATITATITVTPTLNGCSGNPTDFTITVKPAPSMNSISSQILCANASTTGVTFEGAPSGTTFSWSNTNTAIGLSASGTGTGIASFMASNTTNAPISATITVTPSLNGCSGNSTDFTFTVDPSPNIIASPSSVTIIQGNSTTLNVTGGSTYSWSPTTGLSCTNCANPIATPSNTTSYVVTSTNTYGCSSSATTQVIVEQIIPCSNCTYTLSGNLNSNPVTKRSYCVNSNLNIINDVTFTTSEFKMASNVTIFVQPGAKLTIQGCHLYSCGNMWNGIVVQPGGKLVIDDGLYLGLSGGTIVSHYLNSFIEDAKTAVLITDNSPLTVDILKVNNALFNRNQIGIRIGTYTQNITTAYPFSVKNSIFTCRNISFNAFLPSNPNTWARTSDVRGSSPTNNTNLGNVYINNILYSQTNTNAFLKAPFANQKSSVGIELSNVGLTLNANTTAPTYREFVLGDALSMTIFDNQIIGVNSINSNFTTINSVFQNTGSNGVGIYTSANADNNNRLQVLSVLTTLGMNKFVDCGKAVYSNNYFEHNIQYSDVRSTQISGNSNSTKRGFIIKTNKYRECNIVSNSLYNVADAVSFEAINGPYNITGLAYSNGQYAGKVNVDFNTIRPHLSGSTVTTQYVNNAIYLVNTGAITESANNLPSTISTKQNTIQANRAVYYALWLRQNCQIQNNNITVLLNPNFFSGAIYYGISVNNSQFSSSNGSFIRSNTVNGFYTPTSNPSNLNDPNLTGIVASLTSGFVVTCNNTSNTARGIGFSGGNSGTLFKNNKMQNHRYGFFLDQNGSIGQQGSAPVGSTQAVTADNQWLGTWLSSNFRTATLNGSTAQNSNMYVRSAIAYNPNGSGFSTLLNNSYSTLAVPQTLFSLPIPSPIFDLSCLQFITLPFFLKNLELVVQDSVKYSDDFSQLGEKMRYINKSQTFFLLKTDSTLVDSSFILHDFSNSLSISGISKLFDIQKMMFKGNLLDATLSNLIFVPQNNIEENNKVFQKNYINYKQCNYGYNDSIELRSIAEKCPFNDGSIVYQARALYNLIFDTLEAFVDQCPEEVAAKSMTITNETLEQRDEILIYPNPSKEEIFISLNEPNLLQIAITVTDANGKVVFVNSLLNVTNGIAKFTLDVENGIYFIHIINANTNEGHVEKLVIQK